MDICFHGHVLVTAESADDVAILREAQVNYGKGHLTALLATHAACLAWFARDYFYDVTARCMTSEIVLFYSL